MGNNFRRKIKARTQKKEVREPFFSVEGIRFRQKATQYRDSTLVQKLSQGSLYEIAHSFDSAHLDGY